MTIYNENDPGAAEWLRRLIKAGEITEGHVEEKSIVDIKPGNLTGHERVHLFAGIGGWDYALRLAGWPDDRPVWTGSCPCQPFSVAGKGKAAADERHLWPEMLRLITECRPATIFGEQVASRLGREWLSGVRTDLEALGYDVGAADLCAAGVGAPHIRQRLFWVADLHSQRRDGERVHLLTGGPREASVEITGGGANCRLGDSDCTGLEIGPGPETRQGSIRDQGKAATTPGPWSDFYIVPCADGKARRVGAGLFPLAYWLPRSVGPCKPAFQAMGLLAKAALILSGAKRNRIGRLRGYGNAIVPEVAAVFIREAVGWRGSC